MLCFLFLPLFSFFHVVRILPCPAGWLSVSCSQWLFHCTINGGDGMKIYAENHLKFSSLSAIMIKQRVAFLRKSSCRSAALFCSIDSTFLPIFAFQKTAGNFVSGLKRKVFILCDFPVLRPTGLAWLCFSLGTVKPDLNGPDARLSALDTCGRNAFHQRLLEDEENDGGGHNGQGGHG